MKFYLFLFLSLFINIYSKETILFSWQMNRHGARAPYLGVVNGIDAYKENWTQIEELSDVGKRMLYLLGVKVKKRYVDDYKLLKPEYNPQDIYIRSTDVNRTIESIESYLQGLYPQYTGPSIKETVLYDTNITYPPNRNCTSDFEKIVDHYNLTKKSYALPYKMSLEPVHLFYKPLHEFGLYDSNVCTGHKEIYENQKKSKVVRDFGDELLSLFPFFYDLEGVSPDDKTFMEDYSTLYKYMDGFICDDVDRRNFSYVKEKYKLTQEQYDLLRQKALDFLWIDYSYINYPEGHEEISIVANSYTMHSIVNWMELAKDGYENNKQYIKFVIYSAHDSSIGALEHFMKYAFNTKVEYASFAEARFIELYKDEEGNLKVRYLKGDNTIKFDISYDKFKSVLEKTTWTDEQVDKFCNFIKSEENKNEEMNEDQKKEDEKKEDEKKEDEKKEEKEKRNLNLLFLISIIVLGVIVLALIITLIILKIR